MKPILALAVLVLVVSVPAHAQVRSQVAAGAVNITRTTSGGGASTGGSGGGSVTFHAPSKIPTTQFQMSYASGSSDFFPSTYVAYDKALAAGQTVLTVKPQSIVEVARANQQSKGPDSEYVFTQDRHGNLVEESRR